MCGIFGFVRSAPAGRAQLDFMSEAFVAGQLRGPHGTGVIVVKSNGKAVGHSEPIIGSDFIRCDSADKTLSEMNGAVAAVGHNRWTTSGQNIADHCHPFEYSNILGVHNGTLTARVLQAIDPEKTHPVDSARLYAALARADDPIEVLKEVNEGAYAMVWYNSKTKVMHMARNYERPLHILKSAFGVYFASEKGMLEWVAGRNNAFAAGDKIGNLKTNHLYSFPLKDLASTTAVEYTPVVKPYVATYNGWMGSEGSYYENAAARWHYDDAGRMSHHHRSPAKPVALPFVTHFSLIPVLNQHPYMEKHVTALKTNIFVREGTVLPAVRVVLMNKVIHMDGSTGLSGFIAAPKEAEIEYGLPVFIKTGLAGAMATYGSMLPPEATEKSVYPVIDCLLDKFQVTADGTLICVVRPAEANMEPVMRFNGITPAQSGASITLVENEALLALSGPELLACWQATIPADVFALTK